MSARWLCAIGRHRWRLVRVTCPGDCDICRGSQIVLEHGYFYSKCERCGKETA